MPCAVAVMCAVVCALVVAPWLASAWSLTMLYCSDLAFCQRGCKTMNVPTDVCYELRGRGDTWMCSEVITGPSYNVRGYKLGSNCTGTPIYNRANYCGECKGRDPDNYVNMQRRSCTFNANQTAVMTAAYFNCTGENTDSTCTGCDTTPDVVFSADACVRYRGAEWRIVESTMFGQLMNHVNYNDANCTDYWWGDRIVLNECNGGFKFVCSP